MIRGSFVQRGQRGSATNPRVTDRIPDEMLASKQIGSYGAAWISIVSKQTYLLLIAPFPDRCQSEDP
jgi:hypothetical protein